MMLSIYSSVAVIIKVLKSSWFGLYELGYNIEEYWSYKWIMNKNGAYSDLVIIKIGYK